MRIETRDRRPKIVTRDVRLAVELRADDGAQGGNRLVGYAAKFDVESSPLFDPWMPDGFVEVIAPGAFTRTLKENTDIRALYNHDSSVVLGRTKSGTLRLEEDEIGLHFEVDLPDTQAARDVRAMVARGDIDGCSFGFQVVEHELHEAEGEPVRRTLLDIELIEISPAVAFPAYEASEVALRNRPPALHRPRPRLHLARLKARALGIKS